MSDLLERLTIEGMQRMRWTRKRAETEARKRLDKVKTEAQLAAFIKRLGALDDASSKPALKPSEKKMPGKPKLAKNMPKPKRKLTRAEIAKLPPVDPPRPKPRTALQRLERAMGPDDGRRRRGGSPVVQGGSPGLGRRR